MRSRTEKIIQPLQERADSLLDMMNNREELVDIWRRRIYPRMTDKALREIIDDENISPYHDRRYAENVLYDRTVRSKYKNQQPEENILLEELN